MSSKLPELTYGYNDLEPHIDARTMEIHHSKHHAGYTNKLNNAIQGTEFENKSIEEILASSNLSSAIRNNGGGYYNHCLFWEIISPNSGGEPKGSLSDAIKKSFGSFDEFKSKFSAAAGTRFGSGWAWLCASPNGELDICSPAKQDNPLMPGMCGGTPILGIDVWEHAYYLNYQNRRPDYVDAFFNVINWDVVSGKYESAIS